MVARPLTPSSSVAASPRPPPLCVCGAPSLPQVLLPVDLERVTVVRRAGGHGQGADGDARRERARGGDRGPVDGALAGLGRGAVHRDHPGEFGGATLRCITYSA